MFNIQLPSKLVFSVDSDGSLEFHLFSVDLTKQCWCSYNVLRSGMAQQADWALKSIDLHVLAAI